MHNENNFKDRILFLLFHLLLKERSIVLYFLESAPRISSEIFSPIFEARVSPRPIRSVSIRPIAGINFLKNKPILIEVNEPRKTRSSSTRVLFDTNRFLLFFRSQFQLHYTRSFVPRLVQTNPKRNAEFSNILFSFSFDSVERIDSRFDLLEKRRDWRIVRGGLYVVCVTSSRPVTGESKKRARLLKKETKRVD